MSRNPIITDELIKHFKETQGRAYAGSIGNHQFLCAVVKRYQQLRNEAILEADSDKNDEDAVNYGINRADELRVQAMEDTFDWLQYFKDYVQ